MGIDPQRAIDYINKWGFILIKRGAYAKKEKTKKPEKISALSIPSSLIIAHS